MSKSLTDMRAEARATYDAALLDPDKADWKSIAESLVSVLPATRKATAKAPSQYEDYANPKRRSKHLRFDNVAVTFADGEVVNVSVCGDSRKLTNWGPALRCAASFYRTRMAARYYDQTNRNRKDKRAWWICDLSQSIIPPAIVSAVNLDTKITLDMSTRPEMSKKPRNLNKLFGMGTWQTIEVLKSPKKLRKAKKELKAA